jgi:hypothetical protein
MCQYISKKNGNLLFKSDQVSKIRYKFEGKISDTIRMQALSVTARNLNTMYIETIFTNIWKHYGAF